jgi:hypothetical protein
VQTACQPTARDPVVRPWRPALLEFVHMTILAGLVPRPASTRSALLVGLALAVASAGPARAQDADLEPLLLALEQAGTLESAQATSYRIYQIPLSQMLRAPDDRRWGLELTLPVSLGANELSASTSVGDFLERIQTLTVTPGLEMLVPLGHAWTLKPYTEVGLLGTSGGGGTGATVALGVRSVGVYRPGAAAVTIGLAANYASPRTHRDLIEDYTSLEAGLDAQWSLGFSLSRHTVSGGLYGIARYFPDLRLGGATPVGLTWVHEIGISMSTRPTWAILGVKIPWVGLGYRFGDAFSGIRLNLSFPF